MEAATWNGDPILKADLRTLVNLVFPKVDEKTQEASKHIPTLTADLRNGGISNGRTRVLIQTNLDFSNPVGRGTACAAGYYVLSALPQPTEAKIVIALLFGVVVGGITYWQQGQAEAEKRETREKDRALLEENLNTIASLISENPEVKEWIQGNGYGNKDALCAHFGTLLREYEGCAEKWETKLPALYESFEDADTEAWLKPVELKAKQE